MGSTAEFLLQAQLCPPQAAPPPASPLPLPPPAPRPHEPPPCHLPLQLATTRADLGETGASLLSVRFSGRGAGSCSIRRKILEEPW